MAIRVQFGHGLKALGHLVEAEAAYRIAAAASPDDPDVEVQIGHVLKLQGRLDEALAAYARALAIDPEHHPARIELIAAGGRSRLPDATFGRSPTTDALVRLSSSLRQRDVALTELALVSTYPLQAYDAFRRAYPIQSPPLQYPASRAVVVIIDAKDSTPAALRTTLISLIDQRMDGWTAIVRSDAQLQDHAVGSLQHLDQRILFAWPDVALTSVIPAGAMVLLCDAGLLLDKEALGWLAFAAMRTQAELVYADHDHHTRDWRRGPAFADPVFLTAADPIDLETHPHPPSALLATGRGLDVVFLRAESLAGPELRRQVLLDTLRSGARAAHLPRLLSSVSVTSMNGPTREPQPSLKPAQGRGDAVQLIHVVIPTRNNTALLSRCVTSLLRNASNREAVRIHIVAHRVRKEARDEINTLAVDEQFVNVSDFDEQFNWSRINNLYSGNVANGDFLVFANDDTEMLTRRWDDRIRDVLRESEFGVVGVRLLYPDRTIQHAGVALGANRGRPVHEGLHENALQGGPGDRWRRRRQVAAVTGAFMAVRHDVFRELQGFDERLAVGYSDLDFCLKVRAAGLMVIYEPSVELIHKESRTRGQNDTPEKIAWDDEELGAFHARWRGWMMYDPGRNPHWVGDGERPFDGLRDLGMSAVLHHLDLSASSQPWAISPEASPFDDDEI